ncbi:MAG TPA: cation transporter dimerization domain-containing protein [Luteibaculaceae bacterium]|nr:cation transporter dimerization domain-containing protein [Luteibaculaceae bacterium]
MHFYVDLHVVVDGSLTVAEGHSIAHAAKDEILEQLPFVADVLIHIEPNAPISSSQGG